MVGVTDLDALKAELGDEAVEELEALVEEKVEEETEQLRERVEEAEAEAERARTVSKEIAASVNVLQEETEPDAGEQRGPDSASSPMDFFLNCQQFHVNQALNENRARAVQIIRRREEFGRQDNTGNWFLTRDQVETGLTAILGERPHRQTIQRVWKYIGEMGGSDVEEKLLMGTASPWDRTPGEEDGRTAYKIEPETDERFEEARYVGLNLLADGKPGTARDVLSGGVTPVVTGVTG